MFAIDFDDGSFELVHLPPKHILRRARLHVLQLPLYGAASLVIHFGARLRRIRRQTVDSTADHRYKISHQHFLMNAGAKRGRMVNQFWTLVLKRVRHKYRVVAFGACGK